MTQQHTPGPLVLGKLGVIKGGPVHHFTNGSGQSQLFMAIAGEDMGHEERDANAARVVLCWNTHDAMLEALRTASAALWAAGENKEARAVDRAIDLATGITP
ncbi:hypothetical protein [Paraburkholderia phenoliruptrix]|uniref:hypothetical protein n=1 Tax=Paraburkholderia phenoliruptrix TaxID=252970 RepID=UPI0034CF9074